MTHTPGPWKFDAESGEVFHDDGDVCPLVATVNEEGTSAEQFFADGDLIAAAPELLAALEHARNLIADCQRLGCPAGPVAIPSDINAAIARAKGEQP
jgi:hypothetical protein